MQYIMCVSMLMQKLHVLQIYQLIAVAFLAYEIVTDNIEVRIGKFVIDKHSR